MARPSSVEQGEERHAEEIRESNVKAIAPVEAQVREEMEQEEKARIDEAAKTGLEAYRAGVSEKKRAMQDEEALRPTPEKYRQAYQEKVAARKEAETAKEAIERVREEMAKAVEAAEKRLEHITEKAAVPEKLDIAKEKKGLAEEAAKEVVSWQTKLERAVKKMNSDVLELLTQKSKDATKTAVEAQRSFTEAKKSHDFAKEKVSNAKKDVAEAKSKMKRAVRDAQTEADKAERAAENAQLFEDLMSGDPVKARKAKLKMEREALLEEVTVVGGAVEDEDVSEAEIEKSALELRVESYGNDLNDVRNAEPAERNSKINQLVEKLVGTEAGANFADEVLPRLKQKLGSYLENYAMQPKGDDKSEGLEEKVKVRTMLRLIEEKVAEIKERRKAA